jgi:hypothetical protein
MMEALEMGLAYIEYVKDYSSVTVHDEADGSPSIEENLREALNILEAEQFKDEAQKSNNGRSPCQKN